MLNRIMKALPPLLILNYCFNGVLHSIDRPPYAKTSNKMRSLKNILLLGFMLMLAGCLGTTSSVDQRKQEAKLIAASGNLHGEYFTKNKFPILTYSAFRNKKPVAVVYLEGDGFAYLTRAQASRDPTPRNPVALKLAALDQTRNVIWIGRPCQYAEASPPPLPCNKTYWTNSRYSEGIIDAVNQVLDRFKQRYGLDGFHLVGYSGGGAVGVFLAARRDDILDLRTVAGNLDHVRLMRTAGVMPLSGSLNPAQHAPKLKHLPQLHYAGEDDRIIPPWVATAFIESYINKACARSIMLPNIDHHQGWVTFWQTAKDTFPKDHGTIICASVNPN